MQSTSESLKLEIIHKPTERFAATANQIGYEAWSDRFSNRPGDVRHTFDPHDPTRLFETMQRLSRFRRFVGVTAMLQDDDSTEAVGTVWGFNDTRGPLLVRIAKRIVGHEPYPVTTQTNVLPAFQRRGIGTRMQTTYLGEYLADQRPTAYVFAENEPTLAWFDRIGYKITGSEERDDYFGEGASPVEQLRLEAPNITSVQRRISEVYPGLIGAHVMRRT